MAGEVIKSESKYELKEKAKSACKLNVSNDLRKCKSFVKGTVQMKNRLERVYQSLNPKVVNVKVPNIEQKKGISDIDVTVFNETNKSKKDPVMFFGGLGAPVKQYIGRISSYTKGKNGRKLVYFNTTAEARRYRAYKKLGKFGQALTSLGADLLSDSKSGIPTYYNLRGKQAVAVFDKMFKGQKKILLHAHSQGAIHLFKMLRELEKRGTDLSKMDINIVLEAPAGFTVESSIPLKDGMDMSALSENSMKKERGNLSQLKNPALIQKLVVMRGFRSKAGIEDSGIAIADTDMSKYVKYLVDNNLVKVRFLIPKKDALITKTVPALNKVGFPKKYIKYYNQDKGANSFGHNVPSYGGGGDVKVAISSMEK